MNTCSKETIFGKFIGKDLIYTWLDFSRETINYVTKPRLSDSGAKFVLHVCNMLDLDNTVFFMSVEITEKYLENFQKNKYKQNESALVIVVIIYISSKIMGYKPNINFEDIKIFLEENNFGEYEMNTLASVEKYILKKIKLDIPLQTTYDEMNILLNFFMESSQLDDNFHKQCTDVLKIYYLHAKMVSEVLSEIYEEQQEHLKRLFRKKLYIPAGILLSIVSMCKGLNIVSVNKLTKKLSTTLYISVEDLGIICTVILETVKEVIDKNSEPEM